MKTASVSVNRHLRCIHVMGYTFTVNPMIVPPIKCPIQRRAKQIGGAIVPYRCTTFSHQFLGRCSEV